MDEKTPLIGPGDPSGAGEPVSRPAIEHAETNLADAQPTINCQVCNHVIPLTAREKQMVAKCPQCDEATPIKGAPPGKQYVRCPCNCLLICKASTTRVGCPRPQCQRIITIAGKSGPTGLLRGGGTDGGLIGLPTDGGTFSVPPSLRVSCGNCGSPFSVTPPPARPDGFLTACINCLAGHGGSGGATANPVAARCPHCRKITSVGRGYARVRWIIFGCLAVLMLIVAIAVTAGTVSEARDKTALYFLWVVLYLIFGAFVYFTCAYVCMPVSNVEIPVLQT